MAGSSGWWMVSDIELRKQTGGNSVMNRRRLLTSMCFGNVCLPDEQWLAHGQAGDCQTGNPPPLPPPPAPPSVSDAAWPVHTSCLCGPGIPKNPDCCPPRHCCPTRCSQPTSLSTPPSHPTAPRHTAQPPCVWGLHVV